MKIFIDSKCDCCLFVLRPLISSLGHTLVENEPGSFSIKELLTPQQQRRLKNEVKKKGHNISFDKEESIALNAEILITAMIQNPEVKKGRTNAEYLAEELQYDYNKIARSFKSRFHKTISSFIEEKRMEEAERLLKNKNLKVSDISERLGICDSSFLTKKIIRHNGASAKSLRK